MAADMGMDLQEVMAMPEIDGWEYYDGVSYVCSSYVTAMYKAAGLFGDVYVNATEFHPRDVYQLDFFDTTVTRPQACIDADPTLPYCQIMGKYRIEIPIETYGNITPYNNMNESCSFIWPDYERTPAGC